MGILSLAQGNTNSTQLKATKQLGDSNIQPFLELEGSKIIRLLLLLHNPRVKSIKRVLSSGLIQML